jgi:hypothetical protein
MTTDLATAWLFSFGVIGLALKKVVCKCERIRYMGPESLLSEHKNFRLQSLRAE